MLVFVEEMGCNDVVVSGVCMLAEKGAEVVPEEIVVDGFVDMLVTMEELCTVDVIVGAISRLVDDILVAVVLKDCVVMLVVLKKLWTVGDLVCGVVMPVENNWEGVPVEIAVGVVDMLLPVGALWTLGIVTCCVTLFVAEIEGVAENLVEVVSILVDMLVLEEKIRLVDVVVGGVVGMPGKNVGKDVPVDIVVGVVNTLLSVGELWTFDVVTCCVNLLVEEIEPIEKKFVEVVAVVVDVFVLFEEIIFVGVLVGTVGILVEMVGEGVPAEIVLDGSVYMLVTDEKLWPINVVLGGICMLAEEMEGVAENFVEVVAVLVAMLVLVEEMGCNDVVVSGVCMLAEKVGEIAPEEIVVDGFVDMLVTMEELCTVDVTIGVILRLVDDNLVAVVLKDCVVMLVVMEEL